MDAEAMPEWVEIERKVVPPLGEWYRWTVTPRSTEEDFVWYILPLGDTIWDAFELVAAAWRDKFEHVWPLDAEKPPPKSTHAEA